MDGLGSGWRNVQERRSVSVSGFGVPRGLVAQHTLKSVIGAAGIGVHTGKRVSLTLHPAEAGSGIAFRRIDLPGAPLLAARFDRVVDTRLSTVLGDEANPGLRVGTVEHLLASLRALGVDNALVEIDGPELPILDGSAEGFVFLIDCAGLVAQDEPRQVLEVRIPVRVEDGAGGSCTLLPHAPGAGQGLVLDVSIAYKQAGIAPQRLELELDPAAFRSELGRARTFGFAEDVVKLRAAGLARGGSLANAVVLDRGRVLNSGGLRFTDEFVRHKAMDCVGDLALAGAPLSGRLVADRPGHALNNALLRALFATQGAVRMVDEVAREDDVAVAA